MSLDKHFSCGVDKHFSNSFLLIPVEKHQISSIFYFSEGKLRSRARKGLTRCVTEKWSPSREHPTSLGPE